MGLYQVTTATFGVVLTGDERTTLVEALVAYLKELPEDPSTDRAMELEDMAFAPSLNHSAFKLLYPSLGLDSVYPEDGSGQYLVISIREYAHNVYPNESLSPIKLATIEEINPRALAELDQLLSTVGIKAVPASLFYSTVS